MEHEWMTVEQAADYLQIGRSMTYKLIAGGCLKSVKLGRLRRIPMSAIDDLIQQRLR